MGEEGVGNSDIAGSSFLFLFLSFSFFLPFPRNTYFGILQRIRIFSRKRVLFVCLFVAFF